MDPDHPLAALVRKARQERNGTAAVATKPEEVTDPAASSTPAQYTADREYSFSFRRTKDNTSKIYETFYIVHHTESTVDPRKLAFDFLPLDHFLLTVFCHC